MERSKKHNILIVDDNAKNIQVVASLLEKDNHSMSFAKDGPTAIERAKLLKPDLILLDIMMPGMDGYEVCQALQNYPETCEIPIIFLTSRNENESTLRGFTVGAVDYICKPFDGLELLARVRSHLKLKDVQEELKLANATKDKFLSIIAHDLRGPFHALLSYPKLLLDKYNLYSDEKRKKLVGSILETSEHLYQLVENLLEWSRIQTNKIEFNPMKIDLGCIAQQNILLLKHNADNLKIELQSEIKTGTIAFGDPNMISTVIRNLLSNALKFTPEGGSVRITSKEHQEHQEVTVSDTGVGIDEVDTKKLFRLDLHHTTDGVHNEKGTGLGLIMCKDFIEKNGGKIWVNSEKEKGSDFTFMIPVTDKNLAQI